MQLKELFKTLATRAGVNATEAKLVAAIDAMPDLDVDDTLVANPITQSLITEAEAGTRTNIRKKLSAEALNGVDGLVDPVLAKYFKPEEIEALKKEEKPTMKKIGKLLVKINELEASGSNPSDQAKTIADLNAQIVKLKEDSEGSVATLRAQHQQERYLDKLASKVLSRADITDYARMKDGRRVITDFQEAVEAADGMIDYSTGKIVKKDGSGADVYISNKIATVDSILQQTLEDNKYLKVSEGPTTEGKITVPAGGGSDQAKVSVAQQKNADRLKTQS